jgi:hypothetical protein
MVSAFYVGVAGWVACKALEATSVHSNSDEFYVEFDGLSFENQQSLSEFLADRRDARLFPWVFQIPQELRPFITSIAFGILGGIILLLKKIVVDRVSVALLPAFSSPAFSGLVGMMLFFLSFLAPTALVSGHNPARTEALVAVSVFGGAFSEVAYTWVEAQVKKLFSSTRRRSTPSAIKLAQGK